MKVQDILEEHNVIGSNIKKVGVTRDTNDIDVLRCTSSGVIFLDVNINRNYEEKYEKKGKNIYKHSTNEAGKIGCIKNKSEKDDKRRTKLLKEIVREKKWLDVGAGFGGLMDMLDGYTDESVAVEIQKEAKKHLSRKYEVYDRVSRVDKEDFDVATLFHVLEHMWRPIRELKEIRGKMKSDGKLIVEVPHARDALIDLYNLEEFKEFTFWSEHLILHTRNSLRVFLKSAGFEEITIKGVQRYGLSNHMYWLSEKKPNGHNVWEFLDDGGINESYEDVLSKIDKTDTLMASCVS